MNKTYQQIDKGFHFSTTDSAIRNWWEQEHVFEKMCAKGDKAFSFYEGPPSANGLPGIHHMLSRTTKDVAIRFKTMNGFRVSRKSGWDTHGLPVELQVEKSLGITKKHIGTSISVADFNKACRETVFKYIAEWNEFSRQMGYSIDLENPYVTCDNNYIESVWYVIREIFKKGLLEKRFTIQPYSPKAGTSLSSHELNQPGCYQDITDDTVTVRFAVTGKADTYLLAWTTTPYTLPANAALAIHSAIVYNTVAVKNKTGNIEKYILAEKAVDVYFESSNEIIDMDLLEAGGSNWYRLNTMMGESLIGWRYVPLFQFVQPSAEQSASCFTVYHSPHVKEDGGTGIVHISPAFGQDDFKLHLEKNVPLWMTPDSNGELCPIIDKEGKFAPAIHLWAGRYFRSGYSEDPADNVNRDIIIELQKMGHVFKVTSYTHAYPHCWRTDKPIIYYPIHTWTVSVSRIKERLIALNKSINWVPETAGTSRFGNWLENVQDWNLGRTRYWGTPLPIWTTPDGSEIKCIGSVAELKEEVDKAVEKGYMQNNPFDSETVPDLHRPFIDNIYLVSSKGEMMIREEYVADVWLDAGAMPYAQHHWPFSGEHKLTGDFPADFIAEGVDQTRGWFYTLHVLAGILFDSVAFKNVLCHGLVLDSKGIKMSKRLGNVINPVKEMLEHGADAVRFYIIKHTTAGDNLNFSMDELNEVKSKFLGTLTNTYNFFSLYANLDNWSYQNSIPITERPETDRWIISCLHNLQNTVTASFNEYRFAEGVRAMYDFTINDLSNWYIRLNRKRFWHTVTHENKQSAYCTLYEVLRNLSLLLAPICPFISEDLYQKLKVNENNESVHLQKWPLADAEMVDLPLIGSMKLVRDLCSAGHRMRKSSMIRVRQPLRCIQIDPADEETRMALTRHMDIIRNELNIKEVIFADLSGNKNVVFLKPNYKVLGRRLKHKIKSLERELIHLTPALAESYLKDGNLEIMVDDELITLKPGDLESSCINQTDISETVSVSEGKMLAQLDTQITDELLLEGMARDSVKKIQELRKEQGMSVTDRIIVKLTGDEITRRMIKTYSNYICVETQCESIIEEQLYPDQLHDIRIMKVP